MIILKLLFYLSISALISARHHHRPRSRPRFQIRQAYDMPNCSVSCEPSVKQPVCGSDGLTYASPCVIRWQQKCQSKHVVIDHAGKCKNMKKKKIVLRKRNRRKTNRECSQMDQMVFNRNLVQLFLLEYGRVNNNAPPMVTVQDGTAVKTSQMEKIAIEWKFIQIDKDSNSIMSYKELRSLKKLVRKLVRPKQCARKFTKICDLDRDRKITRSEWSSCLGILGIAASTRVSDHIRLSSQSRERDDDDGHNSGRRRKNCAEARKEALETDASDPKSGFFIPSCLRSGEYSPVQCHGKICWCANQKSGKPLPGNHANKQGEKPNCETIDRPYKGCSLILKHRFLAKLMEKLKEIMSRGTSRKESRISSYPLETVVTWHFGQLDADENKVLEKKELKHLRMLVRSARSPYRKCVRNFVRFCDSDSNRRLTMKEFIICSGVKNTGDTSPAETRRRGRKNPIERVLQPRRKKQRRKRS